jgi:hypothetical protein
MPDAVRTLRCLVEGRPSSFKVTVPVDGDIDDMKEAIKLQEQPELDNLSAGSLNLWKVRIN